MDAVTDREQGSLQRTVEPRANYLVGRAVQEFNTGNSVFGGMLTAVNRQLDSWTSDALRRDAYVAGVDGKHRFGNKRFELTGFLAASRVSGSDSAIARTQRSSVQQFQRPDGALTVDPTRNTLMGWAGQLSLNKNGGGHTQFSTNYRRVGPGFEINVVGFLRRADVQSWNNWFQIAAQKPAAFYRNGRINFNQWNQWTANGLQIGSGGNVNVHGELKNFWSASSGFGVDNVLPTFDDRATRGGPAVRQSLQLFGWNSIDFDPRRPLVPGVGLFWNRGDAGRSYTVDVSPRVTFRGTSRVQGSIALGFTKSTNDAQFRGNRGDAGRDSTHYTVARLDQTTAAVTARRTLFGPLVAVCRGRSGWLQLQAAPHESRNAMGVSSWVDALCGLAARADAGWGERRHLRHSARLRRPIPELAGQHIPHKGELLVGPITAPRPPRMR